VLSRCQIYDFRRIAVEDIKSQLEYVAAAENVTAESDALHIIALKADGALRDALSIFDQLVSFSGHNLTYQQVIDNLNVLDYDYYFRIADCILENRLPDALILFDEIINGGFDGQHFINGMAEHLRNLLICKDAVTLKLLEVSAGLKDRYQNQAARFDSSLLLKALDIANRCDIDYRASNNKRLLVELSILQMGAIFGIKPQAPALKLEAPIPIPKPAPEKKPMPSPPPAAASASITKPSTSPPPQVKPAPGNYSIPTSGISIKPSMLAEPATSTEESIAGEMGEDDDNMLDPEPVSFTHLQLEQTWETFARSVAAKSANLHATLTQAKPKFTDATSGVIHFKVRSQLQQKEINEHQAELQQYLRKQLGSQRITIQTELVEDYKDETPYTPQEKYKKMLQKNPNIAKLKEKLNLEIDF